MLRKDFEARHGSVHSKNAIIDHITTDANKYGLTSDNQPAHIWHIVQNMPHSHFSVLDLDGLRIIFENLKHESRKPVRDYYLEILDHRFFSSGWGWFSRGGRGLSTFPRDITDIPAEERAVAVKVLRTLRNGFENNKYKTKYSNKKYINQLIVSYGGTIGNSKAAFEAAQAKLAAADKLPRKTKKQAKKTGLWGKLFQSNSR